MALLTDEAFTVEYTAYESFDRLKNDFLRPVKAIFSAYKKDVQVGRLGLRYVDTIDLRTEEDPLDWSEYLIPGLLSSFAIPEDPSSIIRSWQIIESRVDNVYLRFQYGMNNPDYPAPIQRKIFTLDNDAYVAGVLDYDTIMDCVSTLRAVIKLSFERAITDKFRRHMGVVS